MKNIIHSGFSRESICVICFKKKKFVILLENLVKYFYIYRGRRGRDRMQSVPITTKIVSSNPVHGEMYSIQHYVNTININTLIYMYYMFYPSF
jgi:hypothetical protein